MKFAVVIGLLCVSSVLALNYETGKSYRYKYTTSVLLNEPKSVGQLTMKTSVGYDLSADVDISVVWQDGENKLVKLQVSESKVSNAVPRKQSDNVFQSGTGSDVVSKQPVYVHLKNDKISQLYASIEEPTTSLNVKRGLASLLQVQEQNGKVNELDASGECTVDYTVTEHNIIKSKDSANCDRPRVGEFSHPQKILGVDIDSSVMTTYDLSDDKTIIKSISSVESHTVRIIIRQSIASAVLSKQSMVYVSTGDEKSMLEGATLEDAVKSLGDNVISQSPITELIEQQCTEGCKPAAEVVAELREELKAEYLARVESPTVYLKVLQSFRNTGKDSLVDILMSDDNSEVVLQLIDIVACTQTTASHEAMMEILDFKNSDMADILDRYLVAVSFLNHPSDDLLQKLLDALKEDIENEKVRESVALALGALANTYCMQGKCDAQIIQDTKSWFIEALENFEEELDKVIYLRAMSNSKFADTLPLIAKYAQHGSSSKIQVTALETLKVFEPSLITNEIKQSLNAIYHQNHRNYESAARGNAADLILTNSPSKQVMTNMILSLSDTDNLEMTAYLQRKIKDVLSKNDDLRNQLRNDVMNDPRVFNYDILAKNGMSVSFSSVMADTSDTLTTYTLDMLMSKNGILRQSYTDVLISGSNQTINVLSVGLFATGLDSFLGEADEADDNDAASGIGLSIMDVHIRPFLFFNGYSEMMSMVWSMSADNIITVLAGNILVHDHSQRIPLQNGINIDNRLSSCVSLDLSGSVEISLWDRTSLSIVSNSGSLAFNSIMSADAGFASSSLELNADAEITVQFTTSVDFYDDPVKVCLQMSQPAFDFREHVKKRESTPSAEKPYEVEKTRNQFVPDRTYQLHPENSAMCDLMFGGQE
ncbi:microsomal triglyceride transfer protein large subunit-like [Glandiceps talaboti]